MARQDSVATWRDLEQNYGLSAFWYPGIDIGLLPSGPLTEVESLRTLLTETGFPGDPRHIADAFHLKRSIYEFLVGRADLVSGITESAEPRAGSSFPVTFEVAQLVTYGFLLLAAKGFLNEFGKDAYQLLKKAFHRTIRDDAEVEILIRTTREFAASNRDVVVKIHSDAGSPPGTVKRKKRKKG